MITGQGNDWLVISYSREALVRQPPNSGADPGMLEGGGVQPHVNAKGAEKNERVQGL